MSISKRDKNNFRFRVMKNGVNYEMTFYGSEKEAKKAHEEFRLKVKRGEFENSSEVMTLGELWDLYLDSKELEAGTVKQHLLARDSFDFLDKPITDISKFFLKKYHNEHWRFKCDNDYKMLKAVFNFAVELDVLTDNPLSFKLRRSSNKKYEEILSLEELKKLIDGILSLESKKFRTFFLVQLFLGTRYGETAGIVRENVDTVNHVLSIKQQYKRLGENMMGLGKLKTSYSERDVYILEIVRSDLYELVLATPLKGLIFRMNEKHPISQIAANRELGRICKRVGIPKITTHKLRKLAATMSIYSGVDPISTSKMLGHASLEMTEHYLLSMSEKMEQEAKKMDDFIRKLS